MQEHIPPTRKIGKGFGAGMTWAEYILFSKKSKDSDIVKEGRHYIIIIRFDNKRYRKRVPDSLIGHVEGVLGILKKEVSK